MKANEFLKLVGEMRKEQRLFFATRKEDHAIEKREHLIASKQLEKQVDAVVKEGRLEPEHVGLFDMLFDLLDTSVE